MIFKYALILVGLAACVEAAPPLNSRLICEAGDVSFALAERHETLWLELPDGTLRALQINRELSDGDNLVAATTFSGGSTSIVLEDRARFTQTFLPADGTAGQVSGFCHD